MMTSRLIASLFASATTPFLACQAHAALSFASAVNYAAGNGPSSIATRDFNGDGRIDLAVANANSDNVSILLGIVPTSAPVPALSAGFLLLLAALLGWMGLNARDGKGGSTRPRGNQAGQDR